MLYFLQTTGNFVAFLHDDWEPPLIGQVLSIKSDELEIHWWAHARYSLWKPCYKSGELYKETIPKRNVVHWFQWMEAKSGEKATLSKTLKAVISQKYNDQQ